MLVQRAQSLSLLTIPKEEIYLTLGYQGNQPDKTITQLVEQLLAEAAELCIPRYMYQITEATLCGRRQIEVKGKCFTPGNIILSYLPGMTHLCLFVATAGREYEAYLHRLKQEGDIVKEYVADAIGSVIAEVCVTEINKELEEMSEYTHSLPYSPGYCGWDIREQQQLFSLFPDHPCGITLSDSCLMAPVKSVSGFIGLGASLKRQPYRCEICTNKHCYKRKERKV